MVIFRNLEPLSFEGPDISILPRKTIDSAVDIISSVADAAISNNSNNRILR